MISTKYHDISRVQERKNFNSDQFQRFHCIPDTFQWISKSESASVSYLLKSPNRLFPDTFLSFFSCDKLCVQVYLNTSWNIFDDILLVTPPPSTRHMLVNHKIVKCCPTKGSIVWLPSLITSFPYEQIAEQKAGNINCAVLANRFHRRNLVFTNYTQVLLIIPRAVMARKGHLSFLGTK